MDKTRTVLSRYRRRLAVLFLLVFFGLLMGIVYLFSTPSLIPPIGYPASDQSVFDFFFVWLFLLLVGLAVLMRLFRVLNGEDLLKRHERSDRSS